MRTPAKVYRTIQIVVHTTIPPPRVRIDNPDRTPFRSDGLIAPTHRKGFCLFVQMSIYAASGRLGLFDGVEFVMKPD